MEQISMANRPFSDPGAVLVVAHKQEGLTQTQKDKHTDLLYKIAEHFDFSAHEAESLVQQTYEEARIHRSETESCLPIRIRLSKILVHKCVFRISCALFLQSGCSAEKNWATSLNYYYRYRNAGELNLQRMPLSFRVVYLLHYYIGFTTPEIADLLNTTAFKVKERYHKAVAFLINQQ